MTPVRVLVVDDHVFYREGIKTLLAARAEQVTLVGEAATGEEALVAVAELRPDVVLMDLKMPGIGGIAATERLVADHPGIAVLVLTMSDDDAVLPALRAGARGYLLKDAGVDDLVRAISAVHNGEAILAPRAVSRVQDALARTSGRSERHFPSLTDREHDLLAELVRGRTNREIAGILGLSEKTVRNYTSTILAKLHARTRHDLEDIARRAGFTVE